MIVLHIRYFPKRISSHQMCMKNDKELNVLVEGANLPTLIFVKLSDMWSVKDDLLIIFMHIGYFGTLLVCHKLSFLTS